MSSQPAARSALARAQHRRQGATIKGRTVGFSEAAQPLFDKAGMKADARLGSVSLDKERGLEAFIAGARKHKIWDREKLMNPPR
jgi:uncharacterized protein (UPF0210 family)